jgi:hypothetical protein
MLLLDKEHVLRTIEHSKAGMKLAYPFKFMAIGDYFRFHEYQHARVYASATAYRNRRPAYRFKLYKDAESYGWVCQRVEVNRKGKAAHLYVPGDIVNAKPLGSVRFALDLFRAGSWIQIPLGMRQQAQAQCARFNNTSPYLKIGTSTARSKGAQPGRCIIYTKGVE